ncbi:MAG: HAMP domain-containing sensor histidine kinase [Cyanobacteria bacterium J06635_10]
MKTNPSKIHISTSVIDKECVIISIADNGPGISEEIQDQIFNPFFTTKPVGKGTGLGLSISYQIITEKHDGKLYFNSTPSQGAEFVVEIPITKK